MQRILEELARASGEHPYLVGPFLLFVIASSGIHAVHLAAHLFLAFAAFLREQIVHAKPLGERFRNEGRAWRTEVIEIFRFRRMPREEVNQRLRQYRIEADETTEIVEAFAVTWLRNIQAGGGRQPDTMARNHSGESPDGKLNR